MRTPPTLTVIIPAHNEEKTIGNVIRGVRENVPNAKITVVDDGSRDRTYDTCRKLHVATIRNPKRLGLGRSIKKGLAQATGTTAIIDADGEYSPADLGKLLQKSASYDLVLGSRFLGKKPEMSLLNKLGNLLFSGLVSILTGQEITDAQTGLRMLNKKALETIELSGGYTYTQEMVILAAKSGLRIAEVPVSYERRKHGESKIAKNPFAYGAIVLPQVIKVAFRRRRGDTCPCKRKKQRPC